MPDVSDVPASVLLSSWLSACLAGGLSTEGMEQAMSGELHLVVGLGPDPLSPVLALGALRSAGASGACLALPVPGDPAGLAGPSDFNAEALDAGEAVVVTGAGVGLVPEHGVEVVTWHARPAHRPRPLDPGEATVNLRLALAAATAALVDLDVARWQPEIVDALTNLRHRRAVLLPPTLPPRATETVERALMCLEIVALAREEAGDSLTAHEMAARRTALDPLDRAARAALVATLGVAT